MSAHKCYPCTKSVHPCAIHNWHKNIYTGASDLNVLIPNFDRLGQPVRDRSADPIRHLRWVMDQLTDELNVVRHAADSERITTMPEIKEAKAKERGEVDVVVALAKLSPPPQTEASLIHGLGQLNMEINRYSSEDDSISIIPEGRKKAKRFRISKLLEDIANAFLRMMKLQKKVKAAEEQLKKEREQKRKESKGEEPKN